MFFTEIMSKRTIYLFLGLAIIILFYWIISDSGEENTDFSERVRVSLRDAGNQLLRANQDSTSLIFPIREVGPSKFELSFQNTFEVVPDSLVSIVQRSIKKTDLSESYRVEVIQCSDKEVAYSYEINAAIESTIIPCIGRSLPTSCYTIEFRFLDRKNSFLNKRIFIYILIFLSFVFLQVLFYRNNSKKKIEEKTKEYTAIGSFHFYPRQNKLVKEASEIALSKKECELLAIFIANPNQIVRRDELTKKVWEDNGVFVGRSLDTYISKLRKKLKDDDTIKITNVHGVGYKLEVDQ